MSPPLVREVFEGQCIHLWCPVQTTTTTNCWRISNQGQRAPQSPTVGINPVFLGSQFARSKDWSLSLLSQLHCTDIFANPPRSQTCNMLTGKATKNGVATEDSCSSTLTKLQKQGGFGGCSHPGLTDKQTSIQVEDKALTPGARLSILLSG